MIENKIWVAKHNMINIREATAQDLAAILHIYAYEVTHGLATFEETPPSLIEMTARWKTTTVGGFPFLVAVLGQKVVGYAYVSAYRPRPAYRYSVENAVYIDKGARGKGIGKALLGELIAHCDQGDWRQMVAIIGDTGNAGSRALHESLGFSEVGVLHAVGFKLGRWVDSVIMQRSLGTGEDNPA